MTARPRSGLRLSPQRVRFSFDGREYEGQRGDTAASALLANGVRLLGRSFKYRRPRGLLAVGPEEPNALVTVGTAPAVIPNVSAPQLTLRDGAVLNSQNRWPSLRWNLASLLRVGGGFFGAGFYYKTFMWPSWRSYERMIRNVAGLGPAPGAAGIPVPSSEHLSCDVLVAGAGPAGLAAALAAARAGASVVICEREPAPGGELEFETGTISGLPSWEWVTKTINELHSRGARLLTETTVVGGSNGLLMAHQEPDGLPGRNSVYKIRPRRFIIAMGAVERPIAFVDNDRPGVMLLGAAERLLARYGVAVGSSVVLFGNHDRLYVAALRLAAAGLGIAAVVDTRREEMLTGRPALAHLQTQLRRSGTPCLIAHSVVASEGGLKVRGAVVAPVDQHGARRRRIACDAILVSGGWSPSVHAGLHEGGAALFDDHTASFLANGQPGWRTTVGAARGALDLATIISDAYAAGESAARATGACASVGPPPTASGDPPPAIVPYWRSPASEGEEKRQFVDFQNDVTVADLRQAVGEGFTHIEHLKRYTTLNFGTEQGRTGGVVAAAIVTELTGVDLPTVGVSRTRPPYHPVTLASIVGHRAGPQLRVIRRTPLHEWNESNGGVLEHAGYWMRARYYRHNGANAFDAGILEAKRVRSSGGILDSSTLGKIEVAGRDAAAFLDRLYLTKASTIKVGRAKYMVSLREDGFVLDDGLVLRLADDRFVATTSSEHAERILSHFEHYRDLEWSGREVAIANATEGWAVIVVAGPASRASLSQVLGPTWDEALAQLAHMQFTVGRWRESEVRLLRASFSGELAFEVHCRPASAVPLWEMLIAAGLMPYGLEALDILRVEKGYLTSSEINGQSTPFDLGLDALVRLGNPCLGRELLDRPAFRDEQRPRLVGLRAADGKAKIQGGAQITTTEALTRPVGHITSSVFSPTLGEWIALGFVARSIAEGTVLLARDPLRGSDVAVRVTSPVHFDSAGERMKS